MQNSPAFSDSVLVDCLRCRRTFETEEVMLLGKKFIADRYCPVCRAADLADLEERRAGTRWADVQVPVGYRDCSFDNFEPVEGTTHALAIARNWAQEFRARTRQTRGLLFYGPPGAGKTHLAVAILRAAAWSEREGRCLFLKIPEWLNFVCGRRH